MYQSFYKLSGKPFQLSPDANFYYNSKGHNRAMAYLRYGLRQSEGFIIITGNIGTGKTMLMRNLFAELDKKSIIAAQLVSTQVSSQDLLPLVATAFGLPVQSRDKATLLANLETFFRARRLEGKRLLLLVDEAQNLPIETLEELRMLSNFEQNGKTLLQTFLLGQVELKKTLQANSMDQFRQRIIAGFHLRPLDQTETKEYIEHRLNQVKWQNDPEISHEAHARIFEYSGGVPRKINMSCDRILLAGSMSEKHQITGALVETVLTEFEKELGISSEDEISTAAPETSQKIGDEQMDDLLQRISVLEDEVTRLKRCVENDRTLRHKALRLELSGGENE